MSLETVPSPLTTTPTPEVSRPVLTRVWQGPAGEARWVRPSLLGLLTATAFLYLWGLGSSGWANSFYSAAAQAGLESWQALFFGSSDAANSITVDKPPAALWVMGLSVRAFGLSSWAILVPQALMGVASVGLLYGTVRRAVGSAGAGLIAGAVLALTPVAALMFRFNNPDALLVLLMVGAAAATLRAIEATWTPATTRLAARWLALAGALLGLAFLTKMLQAFLVVPGFFLGYFLLSGKGYSYGKRVRDLVVSGLVVLVSAGWWVATVALWPASDRPYIGGSQHNSILELIFSYNGLGRLSGNETGSVVGGATAGGNWGATGWLRMLGSDVGGQVGWLLPAACLLLVAGLWLARRERLAGATAALVIWGCWLLVTAATFSYMQGIFHPYYTVALAPAIGAIVGIGTVLLWRRRAHYPAALTMGAAVAVATVTSFILLGRTPDFVPWLRWVVVLLGLGTASMLAVVRRLPRVACTTVAGLALAVVVAGPAAYTLSTAATSHGGSIPSAGPAVTGSFGPGGGLAHGGPGGGFPRGGPLGTPPGGVRAGTGGTFGGPPGGFPTGTGPTRGTGFPRGGPTVGGGGLLDGSTPSAALTKLLEADAGRYTWVAATVGSNNASGYQLATQLPVMPIGGFNGSDPSPTLAQFKGLVATGRVHYFIAARSGGGFAPSDSTSMSISRWVASTFTPTTVGGITLYDLSGAAK
ncbi:MAG: hypothetical protein QOI06_3278 [Nocardioidaceae bacterium]|nr:hypothetical protein [Nocardioidaceae bacterium]